MLVARHMQQRQWRHPIAVVWQRKHMKHSIVFWLRKHVKHAIVLNHVIGIVRLAIDVVWRIVVVWLRRHVKHAIVRQANRPTDR